MIMKGRLGSGCKIERKSSIEKEPQTLSLDEINYAREAAMSVMSTHSIEESIRIFTEGLQPVLGVKKGNMNVTMELDDYDENLDQIAADHHLHQRLRDIVTAPF